MKDSEVRSRCARMWARARACEAQAKRLTIYVATEAAQTALLDEADSLRTQARELWVAQFGESPAESFAHLSDA